MRNFKTLITVFLAIMLSTTIFCQNTNTIETVLQKGHSRYVSCVAYSPNGKFVVTGSIDNTLKLWNAQNGKEIRSFSMHESFIRTVSFSPDGTKILSSSKDNKAIVYDIKTGQVLVEITVPSNRLFKACFSPDASKILTMDDRTGTLLWDAKTGNKIGTYKKDYTSEINSAWFTSDGSRLMTYVNYEEAQLIDLNDSLNTISFSVDKPVSFAISPNDNIVAIGTAKKKTQVFNLETGKELFTLNAKEDKACDGCNTLVKFSNSGKYIVTAAKYAGIAIWNANKGSLLHNIDLPDDWIDEIAFSPNDKYIMLSADDEIFVWDVSTGKQILDLSLDGLECIPAFSPDGKNILTTNVNNTAALWNISQKRKEKVYGGYLNKTRNDGLKFKEGNWYHSQIIRYLSFKSKTSLSPDGNYIVKGNIDSVAIMLNLESGKIEKTFVGHSKAVLCSDFSNDGKWLITGSGDRTIKLWEVASGKLIKSFKGHQELIFDVKFSSDGNQIASASWDATLRIWDTETGDLLKYIDLDKVSPYELEFTPKDLYLISSDLGKELKLYEVDASKVFRNIVGHTDLVTDICFDPSGRELVTASLDGKVKVWDLLSGMLINKFSGHSSGVFSVAYDPQSTFIASGSNDRTIKIWDAKTGDELHSLTGHSGSVTSLQISKNGERLISCSIDGEIKVWDLKNFVEIYTYIQIDRSNWLAKNPQGYFDGSSEALKNINYVSGLEVIPVGSLFEKYYSPNLIKRVNSGEEFLNVEENLEKIIQNSPSVQLKILPENTLARTSFIDSIAWFKNSIPLAIQLTDQGGGIDEFRIYNNGKLIQNQKYSSVSKRSGKKHEEIFDVSLVAGENVISAVAFDKDRTESQAVTIKVIYDGIESDINLHIFSIGINQYLNPNYELNYAIDDAKAYNKMIKKSAGSLFNHVEEYFIKDSEATKAGIQAIFSEIAKNSGAEDVFIFYFAGHGAMSMGNENEKAEFYIIPFDVTKLYGADEMLKEKAISSDELLELSKQIAARKQMFVLDACQAGGALESFNQRGAHREKAIAQLARSTGTFFLLASGAIQYASETKDLGHGIFTYALLEGLDGKADGGTFDEKITANELKSYVEDRVPELTDEYMLTPQYPTGYSFGQDFPIVIVK